MMKYRMLLFFAFSVVISFSQSKVDYLKQNQFDLREESFEFPQNEFSIIGFGAYHGSAKTYDAEFQLLQSLRKQQLIDYYIPETNYSQAFFFQQFLETGDEELLKELTMGFQSIVMQEGTIETFEHWKRLRELSLSDPEKPLNVIGCDFIAEYKFTIKHILLLSEHCKNWELRLKLQQTLDNKETNFSYWNEEIKEVMQQFVTDYETNKRKYIHDISDTLSFHHIVTNVNYNLNRTKKREEIIFSNYQFLKEQLNLASKKQFFKYGFFHIEKQREEDFPSFFTRLIEQQVYQRDQIITIIGYLTKSQVLWGKKYDKEGNYTGYSIKRGFGIGDYWKEYFKGIRKLKKTRLSDITLFRLNSDGTPYSTGSDLIEVELFLKKSNGKQLAGKPTTDFIDYALLISSSKNQIPLEEMK